MPLETQAHPLAGELTLPPPFTLVRLRELGDAFAHAQSKPSEQGAGTLVYVGSFDLAEQRRFLRAGHGDRCAVRRQFAKAFELCAAKLAAFDDIRATADARHRLAIERHAVFAGTDQDMSRPFGHRAH